MLHSVLASTPRCTITLISTEPYIQRQRRGIRHLQYIAWPGMRSIGCGISINSLHWRRHASLFIQDESFAYHRPHSADHGVPTTADDLLILREEVYRHHDPQTPLLVHCSAGVGRTGTYIALDR